MSTFVLCALVGLESSGFQIDRRGDMIPLKSKKKKKKETWQLILRPWFRRLSSEDCLYASEKEKKKSFNDTPYQISVKHMRAQSALHGLEWRELYKSNNKKEKKKKILDDSKYLNLNIEFQFDFP